MRRLTTSLRCHSRGIVPVMDDALLKAVLRRLNASPLPNAGEDLLLSALQGEDELGNVLGGRPRPLPKPQPAP